MEFGDFQSEIPEKKKKTITIGKGKIMFLRFMHRQDTK